jgi:hypothetical protein
MPFTEKRTVTPEAYRRLTEALPSVRKNIRTHPHISGSDFHVRFSLTYNGVSPTLHQGNKFFPVSISYHALVECPHAVIPAKAGIQNHLEALDSVSSTE